MERMAVIKRKAGIVKKSKQAPADFDRRVHLESGCKLFRNRGNVAATLRQIAESARIQAGSVCYHFSSKEEILREILNTGIDEVQKSLENRLAALPEKRKLQAEDRGGYQRSPGRVAPAWRLHLGEHPDLWAATGKPEALQPGAPQNLQCVLGRSPDPSQRARRNELGGEAAYLAPGRSGGSQRTVEWYDLEKARCSTSPSRLPH